MVEPGASPTRRGLVLGSVVGLLAGSAWGVALQALARTSNTVLSVIGTKASQIVLLDTTAVRAMVMLGPPSERLISTIPMLMTVFNRRLDIVVGSSDALAALDPDFLARWRVGHVFAIPVAGERGSDMPKRTTVLRDLSLDLGDDVELVLRSTTRRDWAASVATERLWAATILAAAGTTVLAPDDVSARTLMPAATDILVTPHADARSFSGTALALNSWDDMDLPEAAASATLIQIFPGDIARFVYGRAGIALPSWAVEPKEPQARRR